MSTKKIAPHDITIAEIRFRQAQQTVDYYTTELAKAKKKLEEAEYQMKHSKIGPKDLHEIKPALKP